MTADTKTESIVLTAEEVRAALAGKDVLRPVEGLNDDLWVGRGADAFYKYTTGCSINQGKIDCPFGPVGSVLWVREEWAIGNIYDHLPPELVCADIRREIPENKAPCGIRYPATHEISSGILIRSASSMPRWASRYTVENKGAECVDGVWSWALEMKT